MGDQNGEAWDEATSSQIASLQIFEAGCQKEAAGVTVVNQGLFYKKKRHKTVFVAHKRLVDHKICL